MYDVQILKKIILTQDLDSLIKIDQVKSFIFQPPEYRDFFSTVLDYVTKYGEFPSNNYLDDFFGTERNSPLNDVWDQVKSSNDVDYSLLSVVDLQVTHNLRQGIIGATHSTNVQLKTSNNSESNGIILDFQSRINEMVSITEKLHSKEEMLSGETALTTVKAYHEKTQGQGYYISKYGYDFIDEVQGGVERSGFIGILASAKQRKSTFLRQMLYKQLIQGHNVGLITLEMSLESVREHCIHHDSIITVKQFIDSIPIEVKIGEAQQYEGWLVDTPDGWVKINRWLNQGVKDTIKITMEDGRELICTPDHKIETHNRGWVEAQHLTENDDVIVKEE